jgi:hypothetical protein
MRRLRGSEEQIVYGGGIRVVAHREYALREKGEIERLFCRRAFRYERSSVLCIPPSVEVRLKAIRLLHRNAG